MADAALAVQLLLMAPEQLGGIVLRGAGPARDELLDLLRDAMGEARPWRRLPAHIDDERLLGGIDLAASLASGKPVLQSGLLTEAAKGCVCVPMAERLRAELAGKLVQAMDTAKGEAGFALVLLDDGREVDERPPANLTDRVAFVCDLSAAEAFASVDLPKNPTAVDLQAVEPGDDAHLTELAQIALALGVDSVRPLLFALQTARAHAALAGRRKLEEADLIAAAKLVLAPRATRFPCPAEPEAESAPPENDAVTNQDNDSEKASSQETPPEDVVLEAVLASIPDDVLAAIADGRLQRSASAGGAGKRTQSNLRGRPLGARPGMPRGGSRLALIDSLRAAAPWQTVRRREEPEASRAVLVRKDDLRVRRFEERAGSVTVFCVDASGSAAAARLAEAKGAVELILAQAYVKRSEVALIAFRGEGAEVLLPPTRSLTRARRALAGLPGGGGTPLASGITSGLQMAESIASRGRTPFLVFLTDGSANIAADGTPGRGQAREDAEAAARRVAASGVEALLIDISPRPRPDAETIAGFMRARYLPLPMADAAALERAVSAAQPQLAGA
ncbi:magnesium chelatase subunit D [Altererythrobacter sp. JGD-16]|uniref:Magnesium chelatase subunit D n=1 Tax=Altererythrobacter lutimaris TaxID=2743979 RepID=A0A850HD28_9SPHN|nr:magnesium chelatase subunit D [Altererythrobacter lutimaris]NVE94991.1 magnesium chelatase subunit D [Altererythrobacter lutimaris]